MNAESKEALTFIRLFDRACALYPEKAAVLDQYHSITYAGLFLESCRLAHFLEDILGEGGPQVPVCLLVGRNITHVTGALAIMRAGQIYVPIDASYPAGRIAFILSGTGARLLLTTHTLFDQLGIEPENCRVLYLDDLALPEDDSPIDRSRPEMICDILFTSGTTGTPKGVVRSHRAIAAAARDTGDYYLPEDTALSLSSVTFSASYSDTLIPLTRGVTVSIVEDINRRNLATITERIKRDRVSIMFAPPQLGTVLLDHLRLPLRLLALGGDSVRKFRNKDVRVCNAYGSTEFYPVGLAEIPDGEADNIPLCLPFPDVTCRVVDPEGRDVAPGETGELWLSGPECAEGYWNDPELTAAKFVDGFFRSGDMVRRDEKGFLYFVNRDSEMIKVNGQRIAPREVEVAAEKACGLESAVCELRTVRGQDRMCLYYTAHSPIEGNEIRQRLAKVLAPYMIPAFYIQMERLPLNANLKVDKKALPAPSLDEPMKNEAPHNISETILLNVAREVLGRDDFGVTDSLRMLGLDSIQAMKIAAMAGDKKVRIKVSDLMKYDTVHSLVNANMSVIYQEGEYDPSLPTVVLVCGITSYRNVAALSEVLRQKVNLYVFEPIKSHFDLVFRDESIEDVVAFYNDILEYTLQGRRVDAFAGHCYGGEIAYRMAARWQEQHPDPLCTLLLDSPWHERKDLAMEAFFRMIPEKCMDDFLRQNQREVAMINQLVRPGKPEYHGKILYFKALRQTDADQQRIAALSPEDRERFWEMVRAQGAAWGMIDSGLWMDKAESVEVFDVDSTHQKMLGAEFVPVYADALLHSLRPAAEEGTKPDPSGMR